MCRSPGGRWRFSYFDEWKTLSEYSAACAGLLEMVAGSRGRWSPYFRTLYHFEAAVGQLYQSYEYAMKSLDTRLFKTDDGSPYERLNRINNEIKHQEAVADQPVWISDDGLECDGVLLKFDEIEELLRESGTIAERILAGG